MNLTQTLHNAVQQDPERPMTICGERVRTVAESAARVARLAGALRGLGVGVGDRVGIVAFNSDRYHEFLLAVAWADAVVVPVNLRWSAAEIGYALRDSQTRVLLVDDAFAPMLAAIQAECAGVERVVFCGDGPCPAGTRDYEDLVAATRPVADARRGGDAVLGVFYTGGTTGEPKGVLLSHNNVLTSALGSLATGRYLCPGGRLLHAAPMFHLADIGIWTAGMLLGSTHVIVPSFTPHGVLQAIGAHGVTDALLVPTMIQMLLGVPELGEYDLSGVRNIIYGASPIPDVVLARALQVFAGAGFTQAYGMTELAPIATLLQPADHDDPTRRRSGGRAALHTEVRVLDESGAEVPRGIVGEIVVRGDNVMRGYLNKPEATAAAVREGWMHTGDGGYMDDAGYVYVVDRLKDMIITGGENVYSTEVENALARHPAVAQCAVIGLPDQRWGERVHAVVVLRDGVAATADELRESCRAHIAGYKVPRTIAFADTLPVSAAGKIVKRELRAGHQAAGDAGESP